MTEPEAPLPDSAPADGALKLAISNAVAGLLRENTGRGPTKARTIVEDDVVVVLLEHVLTKAEAMLVERGQADTVLDLRFTIQDVMQEELVGAIETLTGRTVKAFMSTNHADPDMAAELFMLEPRPEVPALA